MPLVFAAKSLVTLARTVSVECKKQKPSQYMRKLTQTVWSYHFGNIAMKGERKLGSLEKNTQSSGEFRVICDGIFMREDNIDTVELSFWKDSYERKKDVRETREEH